MKHYSLLLSCLVFFSACAGMDKRTEIELKEMRSIQAEQTGTLSEMRQEIRELTGRLDEIQHQNRGKTTALESAIEQLGSRVPPPQGVPSKLLATDEQRIAPIKGDAADKYREGLKLLRTGEFERAHSIFTAFASQNPGTAFTDNAYFWSAISSTKLDRYERAIGEFSDVFEKYPAEDMVAPSLYYMADTLFYLGLGNDGVLTLQKLVDDHPDSEFAKRAKERLAEATPAPAKTVTQSSSRKKR